jgi:hypothetical protein
MKVMAVLLGTALPLHYPAFAQEATTETPAEPAADAAAEAASPALFTADELDTMLAPIALYPDALLAQVLLAVTYPVDVLKADRFLTKNAELDDKARSALAADQEWPEPVRELTAGFPELIARMAEHMEWTEDAGNAVIAQTDDVLSSLQRLRAQAKLNGYLVDNEAMTVEEDEESGNITISSANPEVVYVPQYTETVYTQPAPATPVYVTDDDDWDDYLMTGAIVWGSAIILDEIFDDDDWDGGWNNGWNNGGNDIDWNGDVNIDNGINIGNGNGNGINRPGDGGGIGGIGGAGGVGGIGGAGGIGGVGGIGGAGGVGGVGGIGGAGGVGGIGGIGERPTTLPGRIGDADPDRVSDRKDGTFKPSTASRDAAREKIATTKTTRGGVSTLPAATGKRDLGKAPAGGNKSTFTLSEKPKAAAKTNRTAKAAPKQISKPKAASKPSAATRTKTASRKAPAYKPSSGGRSKAASSRGSSSRGRR